MDHPEVRSDYWDETTSVDTPRGFGACVGNLKNCQQDITGLTTNQLQSGLPSGFDQTVWGQSHDINGGYPYLLALPPQ